MVMRGYETKKLKIILCIILCIVFSACSGNPEVEGKKAAEKFLECDNDYMKSLEKINDNFVGSFDSYSYKTRIEAREKLKEKQRTANDNCNNCKEEAERYLAKSREKYLTNKDHSSKFEDAYNVVKKQNQPVIQTSNNVTEIKILSIIPPKPDEDKIKRDLVGRIITKNRDGYYVNERKYEIKSLEQILDIDILSIEDKGDYYIFKVYIELTSHVSNYEAELTINYHLRNYDDWTIEHIQVKRLETKKTDKYNDCITSSLKNGYLYLTNHCDVSILVEGIMLNRNGEWVPFEKLVNGNNSDVYTGFHSISDYKIQKHERP